MKNTTKQNKPQKPSEWDEVTIEFSVEQWKRELAQYLQTKNVKG